MMSEQYSESLDKRAFPRTVAGAEPKSTRPIFFDRLCCQHEIPLSQRQRMKIALAMATVTLASAAFAGAQTGPTSTERNKIEGTMEHVLPDPESTQKPPEGIKHIKLIAGQHFVWVWYDRVKGNPQYTGGGTYTLTGNSYTEH